MLQTVLYTLKNTTIPGLRPKRVKEFANLEELKDWLKPDMIVKFGGCRDGKGYRRIEEIYERYSTTLSVTSYQIVGRKVGTRVNYHPRSLDYKLRFKNIELLLDTYMTTNDIKKLQAYFDPKAEQFIKIKVTKK